MINPVRKFRYTKLNKFNLTKRGLKPISERGIISNGVNNGKEGRLFNKLRLLMKRLRGHNGCPWDREQTHISLKPYLIEEAYEVIEAIDKGDDEHLKEELGDLLFQILFYVQIAEEENSFNMSEVLKDSFDKMKRRHDHVFGKKKARNAREALAMWNAIKKKEG